MGFSVQVVRLRGFGQRFGPGQHVVLVESRSGAKLA